MYLCNTLKIGILPPLAGHKDALNININNKTILDYGLCN